MTRTGKVLTVLGLAAAVAAPVGVYAATHGDSKATGNSTKETITCPITGEQIEPCCCPLNGKKDAKN